MSENIFGSLRTLRRSKPLPQLAGHLLALSCLAVMTVVYAWLLVARLTTSIPGTPDFSDVAVYVWNTGWTRHALNDGADLLYTDALFVPFGADLRLNTYGLLQGLLAYLFTDWLGVVGAYNLVLVSTIWLNGAVTYCLVQREVNHPLAAMIAAAWFMLSAPLLGQLAVGRSAIGAMWIVSGSLLAVTSLLARPQIWKAVALGLILVAALLSDFQIVLFVAIWLGLYGGYWLWRERSAIFQRSRLIGLALAGLIFALPFLLIYYPALAGADAAGYPKPALSEMLVYSFRFWDYLMPGTIPLVYGYELLVAAVIAVLNFRGHGSYRFWLGGALAFLLLALGPYLQPTRVPLPFAAFSLWTGLAHFRTPSRLAMPALIGLAMVSGLVLARLLARLRSRLVVGGLTVAAIGSRLWFAVAQDPIRVQTYPDYTTYRQIAREPGDFTLLEVPFGVRSGLERIGQGGEVVQYYQHAHGKRLINGFVSRLPRAVFQFYRAHPSLLFLSGEPAQVDERELADDFAEVLDWSEARYVLAHRSLLTEEQARRIERFLDRHPRLERLGVEGDLVIYRVD